MNVRRSIIRIWKKKLSIQWSRSREAQGKKNLFLLSNAGKKIPRRVVKHSERTVETFSPLIRAIRPKERNNQIEQLIKAIVIKGPSFFKMKPKRTLLNR